VRSDARRGSAAARNLAARSASGEKLIFLDADVTVHPDTLAQIAEVFNGPSPPDAVIGSYDGSPAALSLVSQFRNLLHAHVHQRSHREAQTFWTGCGAIDREWFLKLGGFDERYGGPSLEDVELGLRLHRAGGRIVLAPEIQVTHHKRWTFWSMIRTDMVRRAMPWAGLMRDYGLPKDLNFRLRDRLACLLAAFAPFLIVVALRNPGAWWPLLAADLAAVVVLQFSVLRFFQQCRG